MKPIDAVVPVSQRGGDSVWYRRTTSDEQTTLSERHANCRVSNGLWPSLTVSARDIPQVSVHPRLS